MRSGSAGSGHAWALRIPGRGVEALAVLAAARLRAALEDGPRTVKELGGLATGFLGLAGLWVDLVRVPPSGTWERRRADRLALADAWVGPEDVEESAGLDHLLHAYLRAYGPAPLKDVAAWAGVAVAALRPLLDRVELARYADDGRELLDLPAAPLPDPDTPAPARFLPHWDGMLLVHARRTGVLPEAYRPRVFTSRNPFSVGTVLIDGRVVGAWSMRDGRVVLDPYEELARSDAADVERKREALEAFHA